jgi:lysozyme|tara:strand:- start:2930 stop:3685 length:756 start_codon:yes stop_codon:yes gene_type:complete
MTNQDNTTSLTNKILIVALFAVSVYFFQEAGKVVDKEKQIKTIPTTIEMQKRVAPEIIKAWQKPLLVKPNIVHEEIKEEVIPVLVKPKKSYKVEEIKKEIKKEVNPWDKMFSRVKHYEGFKSKAYRCCGGVMTIGYGHTKNVKWGDTVTEAEASKLLEKELLLAKKHVLRIVEVPLNKNQLAALTSFAFNCGQGSLRNLVSGKNNRLNNGNYKSIEVVMPQYRMAGGKVRKGLELRRKWEVSLFRDEDLLY